MGELFTNVRNGRMVQKYANDPIIASYIAKGVLCLGLLVGGGAGKIVIAHRESNIALDDNVVVVVHALRPAFATVDSEAVILVVAAVYVRSTDEVGYRRLGCWTELVL